MRIEIQKIGEVKLVAENDSDKAVLGFWEGKFLLVLNGTGECELQTLTEIKKIGDEMKWKDDYEKKD